MATVKMLGIQELNRALKAEVKRLEREAVEETRHAAEVVTEAFFDRTPVWMGTTIRNYVWGRNTMPAGGEKLPSAPDRLVQPTQWPWGQSLAVVQMKQLSSPR
jgi:hypothetical protein